MTETDLQKLRGHFHALRGQQELLSSYQGLNIQVDTYRQIEREMNLAREGFPSIFPAFSVTDFVAHAGWYRVPSIQAYLAAALGKAKVALDGPATPVTETRDFGFVAAASLRKVLERDYDELQRVFVTKCWKSSIILAGGCIEAILLDLLLKNEQAAKASSKAPSQPDLRRWDLSNLIDVAVDLKLVSAGVEKLSHSVRDYRNLVHPGNEVRHNLKFSSEEARIAIEVLNIVHRDLS